MSTKKETQIEYPILKLLSGLFKELGLPGFVVVIVVFIFFVWGTPDQKKEFIDRFVLMKGAETDPFPFCLIVLVLVLLLVIGWVYFKKHIKMYEDEIQRLSKEKSELQEKLIEKRLKSSDEFQLNIIK
jgi:p-aminobenzoyl-glutamate transporter AbgT